MSTQYDMWHDAYLVKLEDKAKEFKEFFEDSSHIIHILKGEYSSPPVTRVNVTSVEVIYEKFDIYCYSESFNVYIDKVPLYILQKVNIRHFPGKFDGKLMNGVPDFYDIQFTEVPYNYIQQMKELLLNFL